MPSTPMTGTDTHNGVARPAPAATQRSVETWMQGAQALTVPVDLMSKLPTVDLTRPVEQYFQYVQTVVDLNRDLATAWAELVMSLTGVVREHAETVSHIVQDQTESVADLARVAPRLAFGGPPECPERLYCLLGLKQVYGLRFRVFIPLDAGGPLTVQALQAGDIGVALLFSTDPAITTDHLVVLADDRGLRLAENVVPLVRRDVVGRYGPRLVAVLDTVSARLTTGSLRALNAPVELRGQDPRLVAQSWLRAHGLISAGVTHVG